MGEVKGGISIRIQPSESANIEFSDNRGGSTGHF